MKKKSKALTVAFYVSLACAALASICFVIDGDWYALIWAICAGIWMNTANEYRKAADMWEDLCEKLSKQVRDLQDELFNSEK